MKMQHVTIHTAKLEESVKFYEEIAGLTVQSELRGKGPHDIVFLANAEGETCVELLERGYEVVIVDNLYNASEKAVERIRTITESLPGIDCGVCGSPTCRAFAEDIVAGRAEETMCVFHHRPNAGEA